MRVSAATDKLSSGASIDVFANPLQLTRRNSDYVEWKQWIWASNSVSVNMFQLLQLTRRGCQVASSDIQRNIFVRSYVRRFFQNEEVESNKGGGGKENVGV
jgi:hypothetical protein